MAANALVSYGTMVSAAISGMMIQLTDLSVIMAFSNW